MNLKDAWTWMWKKSQPVTESSSPAVLGTSAAKTSPQNGQSRTGMVDCIVCGKKTSDLPVGAPKCVACIQKDSTAWAKSQTWTSPYYIYPTTQQLLGSVTMTDPVPAKDLPKSYSVEPIVGYRVWNLDREKCLLRSTYVTSCLWPLRKKLCRDPLNNRGIHAVKKIGILLSSGPSVSDPAGIFAKGGLWDTYHADVAGEIWMWGEITECAEGYLAEFAYPKQLWMPEDTDPVTVMQLEENYGVPVTLRSEFKKHRPSIAYEDYAKTFTFTLPPSVMNCFGCGKIGEGVMCARCLTSLPPFNPCPAPTSPQAQMNALQMNALANPAAIVPYVPPPIKP